MNRRGFLRFLGLAPIGLPAAVAGISAAPASVGVGREIGQLMYVSTPGSDSTFAWRLFEQGVISANEARAKVAPMAKIERLFVDDHEIKVIAG
jgi:hypothetical protein